MITENKAQEEENVRALHAVVTERKTNPGYAAQEARRGEVSHKDRLRARW